jgi:hypothetical protein
MKNSRVVFSRELSLRGKPPKIPHMKVLVTGSSGLIGSEAVIYFDREGHKVAGIDNNLRRPAFA